MQALPEIRPWRQQINPEAAEQQVRWLREQIAAADEAIEAQQRIIANDGPREAYLLSIESLRHSQSQMEGQLAEVMKQRDVEVLDFALAGKRYDNHRASADSVFKFLHSLQKLYERVGQALSSTKITTTVPPSIRRQCKLEIAGFFPSSFGIRFTVDTQADLTGTSLSGDALEATFDLVNADNPLEQLSRLGPRVMNSYRHLVTTMVTVEATPKVNWRNPAGDVKRWVTDEKTLMVLANRLSSIHGQEPKTLVANGVLTGASLRRGRFEFNGDYGVITGSAPKELADKIKSCFGQRCNITYVETVMIDESNDQERRSRVLVDINNA